MNVFEGHTVEVLPCGGDSPQQQQLSSTLNKSGNGTSMCMCLEVSFLKEDFFYFLFYF